MKFRSLVVISIASLLALLCSPAGAQWSIGRNAIGPPGAGIAQTDTSSTDEYGYQKRNTLTVKQYFRSLAHKDSINITQMWMGSILLPGSAQIYNRQYWKLPLVYGSIGGLAYAGYSYNLKWQESGKTVACYKNYRNLFYAGAAISYWAAMLDGVANFKYHKEILPARASLYSAILPGLGQAYNGDYWKIPIIYGGLMACAYFVYDNSLEFRRFTSLYKIVQEPGYTGILTTSRVQNYRDIYRRYRDYSILTTVAVYVLNIIDANVFAHLSDFDVSDDLSVSLTPGIIAPIDSKLALNLAPSVGLSMKLKF